MGDKAIQDDYPDDLSHCFGCGRLNPHGHRIQSRWEGEETVCAFQPEPFHTAAPGFVYGGLIASLIDCHSTGTAAAAAGRAEGLAPGAHLPRYVTAMLHVDFLRPTPMGVELTLRGKVKEIKAKKVVVVTTVWAQGNVCASGEVVAVRMPDTMKADRR